MEGCILTSPLLAERLLDRTSLYKVAISLQILIILMFNVNNEIDIQNVAMLIMACFKVTG